jgi:nudix-type nucleoside diphosphatase (YffH/AdpP family)
LDSFSEWVLNSKQAVALTKATVESGALKMSVQIVSSKLLCRAWGTLTEYVFRFRRLDGQIAEVSRELYDRGSASSVLLHNPTKDTVVLVRQFRPAPMVNRQNPFLLEVCAGVLDGDDPEQCARREAIEEAGIYVNDGSPDNVHRNV